MTISCVLVCKGKILLSVLITSAMCLYFSVPEEDNIGMHLIILLNTLMPRY